MRRHRLLVPVNDIRRYFGEQVAYYTAWMNFYTWCLLIPGIAGGSLFAYNTALGTAVVPSVKEGWYITLGRLHGGRQSIHCILLLFHGPLVRDVSENVETEGIRVGMPVGHV